MAHRAQHRSEDREPARTAPSVTIVYAGDRPTVSVTGRVDPDTVTEVSDTVRGLLAVGVRELVVNLSGAVNGAGLLATLARTRAELADSGGNLRLVGVALPEFLHALTRAPLDEVFLIYDTVRHDRTSRDRGPRGSGAPSGPAAQRTSPSADADRRSRQ